MSLETGSASIVDKVRPVEADTSIVDVCFLGATAVFVLGEEALLLADTGGTAAPARVAAHAGGILAAAADERRVVTGGDDGTLVATDAAGVTETIATDPKRRWIDHVALARNGAVAWACGKTVTVRKPKGEEKTLELASSAGGLSFAPKGFRLAVAHYNGVSLWFPETDAAPDVLDWKGSHLSVCFSPDGKFIITTMQEPMLHGWRLEDRKHMRMSGYTAKVRSLDWSVGGKWLASSGSEQLILWPFQGKDGPMGKAPRMLAPRELRVSAVACHPKHEITAVGFVDGMILLVRTEDGAEILVRKPDGAPVSALGWSAKGDVLAFGTENGAAGLLTL
ncbi:MAG: WD40 repeat domain-containing protein [Variibacter sp.]